MLFRKLGKFLRGNASAFNILLATTLGSILAWLPAFSAAPGFYLFLFVVALVFNANLFLLGLSFLLFLLLSLVLTPFTFQIGFMLMEGPLQGIFKLLINAPVTAWFGFEYYLTTGGFFLGLVLGILLGLIVNRLLRGYRRMMANLDEGSPRFKAVTSNFWFRSVAFVLFGGIKGKKSYRDMVESGSRGPRLRKAGILAAVGFAIILAVGSLFLNETILTEVVRSQAERLNGATVDLESFQLSATEGRVTMRGLAVANASDLQRNLFSADTLEADLGMAQLLSKRFVVSRLLIDGARSGEERRLPGSRVGPRPTADPEPDKETDETTIEDLLAAYPEWKQRLTRVKGWLDSANEAKRERRERTPSLRERLREEARQLGYGTLRADHLITGRPTFTLENLEIRQLRVDQLPDEVFHVQSAFLATQPHLLEEGPSVKVDSESGKIGFSFAGDGLSASAGANRFSFNFLDLSAESLREQMGRRADRLPLREGKIDISTTDAKLEGSDLDLVLKLDFRDAVLALDERNAVRVGQFSLPARVHGPINAPALSLDASALQSILSRALQDRARGLVEDTIRDQIGDRIKEEDIQQILPGGLDSLFRRSRSGDN